MKPHFYRSTSLNKQESPRTSMYDTLIQFMEKMIIQDLQPKSHKEWNSFKVVLESQDHIKIANYVKLVIERQQKQNFENIDPQQREQIFCLQNQKPNLSKITQSLVQQMKSNHTHIDILQKMNKQTEQQPIMQRDQEEGIIMPIKSSRNQEMQKAQHTYDRLLIQCYLQLIFQMDLFPSSTLKLLSDKNIEKRNLGAKEIEAAIVIAIKNDNDVSIKKTIESFKSWIQSQNLQQKRSGMFTLLAIAHVTMKEGGEKVASKFVVDLTQPALDNMDDKDEKVKLIAIECLYHLCRTLKELILINFNEIFESMIQEKMPDDEHVRKALFQLDNTLKILVQESEADKRYFNMDKFVFILQVRIKSKNTHVRCIVISWIKCLQQIPSIDMFMYLPQLLEGLFILLGDQVKEIRSLTNHLTSEFFKEIDYFAKRSTFTEQEQRTTEQIIDILISICFKGNNFAQLSAVLWIFEYLRIYQSQIDDDSFLATSTTKLARQYQVQHSVDSTSVKQNLSFEPPLKRTIIPKIPYILEPILTLLSHDVEEIRRAAQKTNDLLIKIMDNVKNHTIEFMNVVPIVKDMLTQKNSTAESALIWMNHLLRIYSEKLMPQIENILSRLIEKLNDAEGTLLQNVMEVLGSISLHEQYFDLVIDKILSVFHDNRELLTKRSDLIIKKLCSLLEPEKVYATICAKLVASQFDLDFISQVVQTMEQILVSDRDLQDLRQVLRNLRYDENKMKENMNTFETLFLTFSYNPMSTITLCFLAEEYELAYNIIISFAEVEIDMDTLIAIAKLVNILESAIFVCTKAICIQIVLRLQLLEHEGHPYILKCLQGLMMLLPQGVAFTKLKQRLKNTKSSESQTSEQCEKKVVVQLDSKQLLTHFCKIRSEVYEFHRDQKSKDIYL